MLLSQESLSYPTPHLLCFLENEESTLDEWLNPVGQVCALKESCKYVALFCLKDYFFPTLR